MQDVLIRGDGVAASCCAHLLGKAGYRVAWERTERPRVPAVMLSENALALIRDVFDQRDLFRDLPRIERRAVAWDSTSPILVLDHSAVAVSEEALLERLRPEALVKPVAHSRFDWTILASQPLPTGAVLQRFGARRGWVSPVRLKRGSDLRACWIESLQNGWLFLIPSPDGSGTLISVGAASAEQLRQSKLIADQIGEPGAPESEFPVYPRIASSLYGAGWIACGTAAMAFDPVCGDGTAHAIREAILASAVIQAVANQEPKDEVLAYYDARLTAGFRRHLSMCREYYSSGGDGPWWKSELHSIRQGLDWCESKPGAGNAFRYKLNGFTLHAVR